MDRIDLAADHPGWNELVDRAEAGESIDIVRDGRVTARLIPAKKPLDLQALRELRSTMPYQPQSGADLIRTMRDSGY